MYNRMIRIGLFGIDEQVATALQELPAPDQFAFEFTTADTIDYMAALDCDISIAAMGSWGNAPLLDISAAAHSKEDCFRALVIVAAPEDVLEWGAREHNMVEAIWPAPLTVNRATFEFERLVTQAKQQAEEYMVRTNLDALMSVVPEMVWFKNVNGEYVKVNEAFCDALGMMSWDIDGQPCDEVWNGEENDAAECKISDAAVIELGEVMHCAEQARIDGQLHALDIYKAPIYDEDGTPLGVCGFAYNEAI